jgi:hypothetical protein
LNKVSLIQPLPYAYRERIARIPGVKELTFASWFGGVYQDPKNFFAQFAIEHTSWRQMYPEFLLSDEQWRAFLDDKAGCIAGETTARRFGWKIGDRIPIQGTIYPGVWEFCKGIYARRVPTTTRRSSGSVRITWKRRRRSGPRVSSGGTSCAWKQGATASRWPRPSTSASRTRPGRRERSPRKRSRPRS